VRKLTLADIAEPRAYERERDAFLRNIIELKRVRRVALGPIMTIVFENTDTMRWQVQEMARVERMMRDDQIEHEIETYNQLIPDSGELSGTLLIELTSGDALREWLPKLVGVECAIRIVVADGTNVPGVPHEDDEARLTRDDVAAAVHFLRFHFEPAQVELFANGPVHLVVEHPAYDHDVVLDDAQHASLLADLRDLT
jgi:hypothetical protein